MTPLLETVGLTRYFGSFAACRKIDLAVRAGERHAILGENGAGKSTLVKMIYGALTPSAGEIRWRGRTVSLDGPGAARALGVGMVHQTFSLFDALTVAENVALALPGAMPRGIAGRIAGIARTHRLGIDPDRPVHDLSAGERQRVEILRCLLQKPRLMIMDEPTSVLTPQETRSLFDMLERLSSEGIAILYISHRLAEVRALCESATILRGGECAATCDPREETADGLAAMMIGRAVNKPTRRARPAEPGPVRLRLNGLTSGRLKNIDLDVRGGEILGIAGIAGEGQSALMAALTGEETVAPDMIEIEGRAMGRASPTERRLAGAAFVPEERLGHAAVTEMALPQNILLSHHRAERLAPGGWIDARKARNWADRVRGDFDVRSGSARPVAGALSGGNLQKFVVGREILRNPRVLAVSQPTGGIDPGATAVIRGALIRLAERGAAVLAISQDLEELFVLASRIAVLHAGRLSAPEPVEGLTAERVGLLMAGARAA